MRKFVKWILKILAVVFSLLLSGAYLSRLISPADFWPFSFFGLVYPLIFILSLVLLVFLIINKNKAAILLIIFLVFGWFPMKDTFRVSSKTKPEHTGNNISLMSYNVRIFDNFKWSGQDNGGQHILDFVGEEQPDIVCFQEFMSKRIGDFGLWSIKKKLSYAPYVHTKFINEGWTSKVGLAIFSKYPIISTGGEFLTDEGKLFIYADVKVNDDVIRVFNSHLESNHLNQKQINLNDSLINNNPKDKKTEYIDIIKRMRNAYTKRAEQADVLHERIKDSPHPVVVCGDFNDTPVSYSYRKISSGLTDAFVSSGKGPGMGATYSEFMLPLRIDYILHDKDFTSFDFETHKVSWSDHKPVQVSISLKD